MGVKESHLSLPFCVWQTNQRFYNYMSVAVKNQGEKEQILGEFSGRTALLEKL